MLHYNDIDEDTICGDIDICPNDPDNDIDVDTICGDIDNCPIIFNTNQLDQESMEIILNKLDCIKAINNRIDS